jgi:putative addiction module antidote
MVLKQKITKIGNSMGIIIPKEIRNALGIDLNTEFYLKPGADNKTIILDKEKPETKVDPQFYKLVKSVGKQYHSALKELANK